MKVCYFVSYYRRGFHCKIFEDSKEAYTAFLRISIYNSPQIKKIFT